MLVRNVAGIHAKVDNRHSLPQHILASRDVFQKRRSLLMPSHVSIHMRSRKVFNSRFAEFFGRACKSMPNYTVCAVAEHLVDKRLKQRGIHGPMHFHMSKRLYRNEISAVNVRGVGNGLVHVAPRLAVWIHPKFALWHIVDSQEIQLVRLPENLGLAPPRAARF
ncbi:unknown [Coraliomargarita sp. CAG:312]|nr:unknown [Coraliomargarita sp. CAG:312]